VSASTFGDFVKLGGHAALLDAMRQANNCTVGKGGGSSREMQQGIIVAENSARSRLDQ
jgi:hypothetical protein